MIKAYSFLVIFSLLTFLKADLHSQTNPDTTVIDSLFLYSFLEFQEEEKERAAFIAEVLALDSLIIGNDYLNKIQQFHSEKLSIDIKNKIISLDFPGMYDADFRHLNSERLIPNISQLSESKELKVFYRGIASDIDVLPRSVGNIQADCKILLKTIKNLIRDNENISKALNYSAYLNLEVKQGFNTDSDRLYFRKNFIKFLHAEFHPGSY